MTMLKRIKYLWLLLFLVVISIVVVIPRQLKFKLPFSSQPASLSINLPQLDFFLWGRRINLQPDYRFGLEYVSGELFVYQALETSKITQDQLTRVIETTTHRLKLFFQEPVKVSSRVEGNNTFLLLELLPGKEPWLLSKLLLPRGEFEVLIQRQDTLEDEIIFADNWLEKFESIGVDSNQIMAAKAQLHPQTSQPIVQLTLTDMGRQALSRATRVNVGRLYLITIDGNPVAMPPINEPIFDGKVMISGGASLLQARLIASVLQGGMMPVDLEEVEEHSIQAGTPTFSILTPILVGAVILFLISVLLGLILGKLGWLIGLSGLVSALYHLAVIRLAGVIVSPQLVALVVLVIVIWLQMVVVLVLEANLTQQTLKKVILLRKIKLYLVFGLLLLSAFIVLLMSRFRFWQDQLSLLLFARTFLILIVTQAVGGLLMITSYVQLNEGND